MYCQGSITITFWFQEVITKAFHSQLPTYFASCWRPIGPLLDFIFRALWTVKPSDAEFDRGAVVGLGYPYYEVGIKFPIKNTITETLNFQELIQLLARTFYYQEQKETVGRKNLNTFHQIFFWVCRILTGGEIPLSKLTCFIIFIFEYQDSWEDFHPNIFTTFFECQDSGGDISLPSMTMILSHGQIILSTAKCKSEKFLHFSLEILQNAFW